MLMPHLDVDGSRIHYDVSGSPRAPVLLLSHSVGTSLAMWDDQTREFEASFRVVRYDSRGHGQSDAPPGPYTIERLGRDASALLRALEIPRAHVCGLSLGGMVGMWLAVNHPDQVDRLVLANTSAHLPPPSTWNDRIAAVRANGMASIGDLVVDRWFTRKFQTSAPGVVARFRQILVSTPPEGYIGGLTAIRDFDFEAELARITRPTLVIVGAHDPATPPSHGELIADRIPGASLVTLQASHISNAECADEFDESVATFLKTEAA
jgi:3-oxoadipate enol-lactonase